MPRPPQTVKKFYKQAESCKTSKKEADGRACCFNITAGPPGAVEKARARWLCVGAARFCSHSRLQFC